MGTINVIKIPRPERPALWKRVILWELLQGMWVTFVHFGRGLKEPFTVQYPEERLPLQPRFRGYPRLRRHPETGEELCIACQQCEKICPDQCIKIESEPHPSGRGKRPKSYTIDYERCCLCGLCVDPCPTTPLTAIYMSHDYELAMYERSEFSAGIKDLYNGKEKLNLGRSSK